MIFAMLLNWPPSKLLTHFLIHHRFSEYPGLQVGQKKKKNFPKKLNKRPTDCASQLHRSREAQAFHPLNLPPHRHTLQSLATWNSSQNSQKKKQYTTEKQHKRREKKTPQCILGLQKCPRASAVDYRLCWGAPAPPQCHIPVRLSELVEGADGVSQEGDQAAVQTSPVLPLRTIVLKHTQTHTYKEHDNEQMLD